MKPWNESINKGGFREAGDSDKAEAPLLFNSKLFSGCLLLINSMGL